MSDTKLKVGDVCREPLALRAGMTVRACGDDMLLRVRRSNCGPMGWEAAGDGCSHWIGDAGIRDYGVTILALPEEAPRGLQESSIAPLTAAPSLESVPVGSRWRRNGSIVQSPFTVVARDANGRFTVHYDDDQRANTFNYSLSEILAHATRIDEPAGVGKAKGTFHCAKLEIHLDGSYTVTAHGGTVTKCKDDAAYRAHMEANRTEGTDETGLLHDRPFPSSGKLIKATPIKVPPMPPARCAPGCTPSKSCRITIPVTDQGTRYECPALREDRIEVDMLDRAIVNAGDENLDQAEARSMRGQRWEAMNAGPMVGRYRFNRR